MNRPNFATVLLLLSCCVCRLNVVRAQENQRDSRKPSLDSDDVLKRFVDELVVITPGEDKFPRSVKAPSGELRPPVMLRIACYETTQELYQLVMGENPSEWKGPRNSAESMSRVDADRFCSRLTQMLQQKSLIAFSDIVRLPTDVEWEYCCRAGSREPFCFGPLTGSPGLLDQYAWHTGNAAGNDPAVGVLLPNTYGLFDVHGYLWEYVDVADGEGGDAQRPVGWAMGGSWRDPATLLASDSRIPVPRYATSDAIGFRCVVSSHPQQPQNQSDR